MLNVASYIFVKLLLSLFILVRFLFLIVCILKYKANVTSKENCVSSDLDYINLLNNLYAALMKFGIPKRAGMKPYTVSKYELSKRKYRFCWLNKRNNVQILQLFVYWNVFQFYILIIDVFSTTQH